jgi:glucose/arabinose dehydrogenase
MMRPLFVAALLLLFVPTADGYGAPTRLVEGLHQPTAAAVGLGGKVYVAVADQQGGKAGGTIVRVENGKVQPFADGLDEPPQALAAYQQWLFAAQQKQVVRIGPNGKAEVLAAASAFPSEPRSLSGLVVDPETGTLFLCDAGDRQGQGGAIYRITPRRRVSLILDAKQLPSLHTPSGLVMDGQSHLLLLDAGSGELRRIKLADLSTEKLADGLAGCEGLAWDQHGRLFLGAPQRGQLLVLPRAGQRPVPMTTDLAAATGFCLGPTGQQLLLPDARGGTLSAVAIAVPGAEVDQRPLAVETAVAFPELQWTGWKGETESGKVNALRPIVLTHAGDGSNRVFVATQQGVIHVFANDQKAKQTRIFLDLQDRVTYNDQTNEEGLLGLAFHPRFKENGEFFIFYTPKTPKLTNIVSRFRVRKDDPTQGDPNSEEELLRFTKPYWNHDGGTLCFGPDGFLYLTHGDGGSANDPHDNGQNLQVLLGKVLRLDVDHKDAGKNYAVPKDNPFVRRADARPEIWAYGVRNLWRMAFDRATGVLWAGDVGQNLYEEIDLIQRGGNYGWNRRESLHPFGPKGKGPSPEFIDPIWEYRHDAGACIIGGTVYRGPRLPELQGYYVYADYTNSRLWALRYDAAQQRVVENRPIKDPSKAILSFGEDEAGEVYLLTPSADGRVIFRYVKPGGQN